MCGCRGSSSRTNEFVVTKGDKTKVKVKTLQQAIDLARKSGGYYERV